MGFFYKAGAAAGVTVVEGASYDALATSAKTQAHDTLMLDTSTGFYYKVWKTGGPGIPVPVRFFDDLTGYASNSGSNRSNCYFTLDDVYADFIGTTAGQDFTVEIYNGNFTITKTAGNPLILSGTGATPEDNGSFYFQPTSTFDKCLTILKINSITGTSNHRGYGSMIRARAASGGTSYTHRINLSTPTAPSIKVVGTSGSSTATRQIGPELPITAPEWFWFLNDASGSDALSINSYISSGTFHVVERDPAETSTSAPLAAHLYLSSTSTIGAQEFQVSELHSFIL